MKSDLSLKVRIKLISKVVNAFYLTSMDKGNNLLCFHHISSTGDICADKKCILLELEMHHLTPVTMWEIHINILNESRGVNCRDHFLKVKSTSYSRIFP